MKKNITILSIICLAIFALPNYVEASDTFKNATDVFTQSGVDDLQRQIEQKQVTLDKDLKIHSRTSDLKSQSAVARSMGIYPTRKGLILVTADAYKDLIPTGHAAIVYNATTVVESLAKGVTTGNNNWNESKKSCYGVTVKGTTITQDEAAANWCYNQISKPYNFIYLNTSTREKFYCSQLIWAAYLDNYGIDLNTDTFWNAVHPLELVSSDKTKLVYEK